MKPTILILAVAAALGAQVTRREVTNPSPNPADDSKPNSGKVPEGFAINTNFTRIAILRFKSDTDLLVSFEKLVKQEKIRNAVILAGLGSVRSYHIHQISNRTFPTKNTFEKDPAAPADLIGMTGYVMGGRIHAHMTLANPDRAFGGHLEPGTNVFTYAIVTLGVLGDDVDLSKIDDKAYR